MRIYLLLGPGNWHFSSSQSLMSLLSRGWPLSSMFALSRGHAHWQAAQEEGQHPIKTWKESFGNKSWFAFTRVPIIYVMWNGSEMWVHFCPHSPFLPPPNLASEVQSIPKFPCHTLENRWTFWIFFNSFSKGVIATSSFSLLLFQQLWALGGLEVTTTLSETKFGCCFKAYCFVVFLSFPFGFWLGGYYVCIRWPSKLISWAITEEKMLECDLVVECLMIVSETLEFHLPVLQ